MKRRTRPRRGVTTRAAWLLGVLLAGCISIPDEVEADFEPPDGRRPNNFGRVVDETTVVPDAPTIPAWAAEADEPREEGS